ncbi:MAG: hypothetical protein ABFS34_08645 [Gemmatimonadota bacterium]
MLQWVRAGIRLSLNWIAWLVSRYTERAVCGVRIRSFAVTRPENDEARLELIAASLRLLARTDRRSLDRVRQLRGIMVSEALPGANGAYLSGPNLCTVDPIFLDRTPKVESVAAVLVHEATHARIQSRGVSSESHRLRIEEVCHTAEIAFARRATRFGLLRQRIVARARIAETYHPVTLARSRLRGLEAIELTGWPRRFARMGCERALADAEARYGGGS